jgi:hypothetical protein
MPTKVVTTTPEVIIPPNRRRISVVINNLDGNNAVGLLSSITDTYDTKNLQLTGGQSYEVSISSAVVGVNEDGTPRYVNQKRVTNGFVMVSSSGNQTISYEEGYP